MDPVLYRGIAANEGERWWDQGRRAIITRLLAPFLSPARTPRILSAGCGTGGELRFLSRFGDVIGVDAHDEAIRYIRASGLGDKVIQAPVEALPFPDRSFDFIFALDLLEHVADDRLALQELRRTLRDGGIAYFTVPAFSWLWSRSDEREHHYRRYRRKDLALRLREAGFTPIRITYFNTFLFVPIMLAKLSARIFESGTLAASEVRLPPFLNRILFTIFSAESFLLPRMNLPVGISVLAIVRR